MRIHYHDILVTIIYSTFSQDPGILNEQGASYDDGLRPGDIFIQTFKHGHSANNFDVSVRSTIQPAFISSSACCAGVAAAAGEVRNIWQQRLELILFL